MSSIIFSSNQQRAPSQAKNLPPFQLPWDPELKTNQKSFDRTKIDYNDRECAKEFSKGDEIGEFNLGSTIVLAFEAPRGLNFKFEDSEVVRLG
ncbi:unnamed protein product [Oikopleura dioica]|uniref:Uncharacterized protein n=1 Tax=Oikopleura dioica TaxID=34765 RepID=E4Y0S5_OIKDI|nr:unnamed protein product [Oikopleura dioica]